MIPNIITVVRIIISFSILTISYHNGLFKLLYLAAGISDLLDGYIARKTNSESVLGSRLDSLADVVFCIIVLYKVLPIVDISKYVGECIILVVVIRMVSVVICKVKFGQIAILHTTSNKATGILLFLYFFFISTNISALYQYVLCGIGILSALEELIIHVKYNELNLNRKQFYK